MQGQIHTTSSAALPLLFLLLLGGTEVGEKKMQDKSSETYFVTGLVTYQDGSPLANLTVKAFDRDLHNQQQLGRTQTDRLGAYEMPYVASNFRRAEKTSADVIVKAFADMPAAVLTVVADLKAFEAEGLPMALKFDSAALATFRNWSNLFQTGDLCDCKHCRSVLSPGAYYASGLFTATMSPESSRRLIEMFQPLRK